MQILITISVLERLGDLAALETSVILTVLDILTVRLRPDRLLPCEHRPYLI